MVTIMFVAKIVQRIIVEGITGTRAFINLIVRAIGLLFANFIAIIMEKIMFVVQIVFDSVKV